MKPPQPESRSVRAQVRLALGSLFLVDADFLAFVGDYFPKTRQRLGDGMDRVQKVNLLLDQEGAEAVVDKLRVAQPEALATYEHSHGPLRAEPRAEPNTDPLAETVRRSPWIAALTVGAVLLSGAGAFGLALVSRRGSQPGNHLDDRNHKPQDLASPLGLTAPLQLPTPPRTPKRVGFKMKGIPSDGYGPRITRTVAVCIQRVVGRSLRVGQTFVLKRISSLMIESGPLDAQHWQLNDCLRDLANVKEYLPKVLTVYVVEGSDK